MRPTVLLALGMCLTAAPQAAEQTAPTADDALVFSAIIDHTIIPDLRRSNKQKVDPPVVLVYGSSVPLCNGTVAGAGPCRIPDQWQTFLTPDPAREWQGIVAPTEVRTALIAALEARNQRTEALLIGHPRVVLIAAPKPTGELAVNLASEIGTAAFALPGYSGDHALTYGWFSCGGTCGRSYLFVLHRIGGVWQVQAAWVTAIG
jgi:hypothetical protein